MFEQECSKTVKVPGFPFRNLLFDAFADVRNPYRADRGAEYMGSEMAVYLWKVQWEKDRYSQ